MENFYHVMAEVKEGAYSGCHPVVAMTKVMKKLDEKVFLKEEKVDAIVHNLEKVGLMDDASLSLSKVMEEVISQSPEDLSLLQAFWKSYVLSPFVQAMVEAIESYHFWTDMVVDERCSYAAKLVRSIKTEENVIYAVLKNNDLDGDQVLSWKEVAYKLAEARREAYKNKQAEKKRIVSIQQYVGEEDVEPKLVDEEDRKAQWVVLTLCGMDHYSRRGMELFEEAFVALAEYAEMGYADMQMLLASFLENTDNTTFRVNEDRRQAHDWYAKAARQNYRPAQMRIAESYCEGLFTEVDDRMADALYEHLGFSDYSWMMMDEISEGDWEAEAEHGNLLAQMELAHSYHRGKNGYEQNDELAFYWTKKAAENGAWSEYDSMAYHYSCGVGTEKNQTLAYGWYRRAAAFSGERIRQKQMHGTVLGSSFLAGNLYKNIADCLRKGEGVEKDIEAAKEWSWRALGAGYDEAWKDLKEDYE